MADNATTKSTYAGQGGLPRLPIPSLEETLERFINTVSTLLSSEEKDACKKEVENFRHNDGPKLQKLLVEYDEKGRSEGTLGSFVEEFWSDAYLAPDSSVVMNLNPFFVLEDGPDNKKSKDQSGRAASLCFSAIKFASSLKKETIVPDAFRNQPLCMDQFKALFGASRVPKIGERDAVEVDPESSHVVVLQNNQMYFFQALGPDGSVCVTEQDICEILAAIKTDATKLPPDITSRNSLGVLTTLPRKEWAAARNLLLSTSQHNETAFDVVDTALFVLVIDDVKPKDIHEAAANMLHGTYDLRSRDDLIDYQAGSCCNRWYDKLQLIICSDGRAGINFEHSAIDGHTALRFVSDIFADNVVSFAQSITKTIYQDHDGMFPSIIQAEVRRATDCVIPKKLTFELPQQILDKIYYAETALSDQIVASETYVLEFTGYGKTLIVRNKMSPDSFVQLSMQLAHFRLYGKIVSQYEPVLTKGYYHGRTEAMRTATEKAATFCRTWLNPHATDEEKLKSLREATVYHSARIKDALMGKGIERHLFALKCIADKNNIPTPDFFSSKAYQKLNHTILSTSNCGNPSLRLFGFGPVVQDGFGIGYIIRDDGLQYSISSKHRQTKRFAHTLKQTLIDMGKLLQPLSSLKVECSATVKPDLAKETAEYLEAYCDTYGEGPQLSDLLRSRSPAVSFDEPLAATPRTASAGFARVLQKQSSISLKRLSSFGIDITPLEGNRKKLVEE